jgi:hypothetical protein
VFFTLFFKYGILFCKALEEISFYFLRAPHIHEYPLRKKKKRSDLMRTPSCKFGLGYRCLFLNAPTREPRALPYINQTQS